MSNTVVAGDAGQALRRLVAGNEIQTRLARYCRGVDRLDAELLRSVYWPDAWDDHGPFSGRRDEFIAWVIPFLRDNYTSMTHVVSNHLIEFHDRHAYSECYFTGAYLLVKDAREYTRQSCGRYIDLFEQRHGEWRILYRTVINDWARTDPVAAPAPLRTPGKRSGDDAVYVLREKYLDAVNSELTRGQN